MAKHEGETMFSTKSASQRPRLEAMECRTFMSAVPLTAVDVPPTPIAPDIASFQAGRNFSPITITPSELFPDAQTSPRWVKVRLVNTVTAKTELTRTYFPAKGHSVTLSNLISDHTGTFNVLYSDSLGDTRDLPQVMVTPAPPHALWFSQQTRILNTDSVIQVTVLDQYGNLTTADDGDTIVLHSWLPKGSPGSAPTLTGETTAVVENGSASFTGLSMNRAGMARLSARLGNLKPTLSNVFQPESILTLPPGNAGPV